MAALHAFLTEPFLGTAIWFWLAFLAIVIVLLVLDLGVLQRDHHEIGVRESLLLSAGYFACGLAFGGWVWYAFGPTSAVEYYTPAATSTRCCSGASSAPSSCGPS